MRMCAEHWAMCRQAIDDQGLTDLVAKSGKDAADNLVNELNGDDAPFDPLMSMNWHWNNHALKQGGLYLMGQTEDGSNDGHYCPLCEFAKNAKGFDPATEIGNVAKQMREYAIENKLVPATQ